MAKRFFLPIALALSSLLFGAAQAEPQDLLFGAVKPRPAVPRVECPTPSTLRLARFEDGSARLECGRRLLVKVSVPG